MIHCFTIALNLFIALFTCFKFIYCFISCFKYYLLLCALDLFIAFHYYFKYLYRFPQYFKYIYRFTTLWILFIVIVSFPRVIWAWKSLVVLADYVSPLRGINNHINPQGIGSMSTPPWLNSVISLFISPPFSLVIWVWKSRLVVVDYVRPPWGH